MLGSKLGGELRSKIVTRLILVGKGGVVWGWTDGIQIGGDGIVMRSLLALNFQNCEGFGKAG